MKQLLAIGLALTLAGCAGVSPAASGNAGSTWVGAWAGSPAPPSPTSPSVDDQTIRQVVRLAAGGRSVRVRLTNEYGDVPLEVGAASIAIAGPDGKPAGTPVALTFGGRPTASVPRGAPMLSDPVVLPVKALDSVSISLFFPHATGPCTCHALATATTWVSAIGDYTKTGNFEPTSTVTQRPFLSAVEVEPTSPTRTIIAFGDSITDGYRSTSDANRRWPDVLAERLQAAKMGVSVSNEAISGNQVLGFNRVMFGDAALARFDRDVLTVPNASWLIVLEGINDIGQNGDKRPSAETMIAGYKQIIARAHAHGLKVIGGTLLPDGGAAYYAESGEVVRQAVNDWIRTSKAFDGVVDFDAVIRDPANPKKMKADLQSGDWLHPNDAGYKLMGETADLGLFR